MEKSPIFHHILIFYDDYVTSYIGLNIYMKRYKATVNAAGMWVETILYAQNQAQAYRLFQAIFGANNVPHQPLQIG